MTARRPSPQPFTVDHYREYASLSVLDDGQPFELEDFQLHLVEDLFAGVTQNWWVLPEGNGKTTFLGHLGLYYGDYTPSAMIPVAASSREQAEILYRQAEGFVFRTRGLRDRFKCQEGYRRIKCLRTGGRLQVYAADDRTGDGIIPGGVALVDELHRHRDLRLYRTWVGKLVKRDAQIVAISTAGEPGGEFEETRERIYSAASETVEVEPCHFRVSGDGIVLHDFRVPDRAAAEDMAVVAQANPRRDLTAEVLRRKRESPTMTNAHWLRFVCNLPSQIEGAWIEQERWDACEEPGCDIPKGAEGVYLGVDVGRKHDHSAVVAVWRRDDGRFVVKPHVLEKGADLAAVESKVRELAKRWRVAEVVYDPWSFERSAELLSDEGLPLVEFPQSHERMHVASVSIFEAVMTAQVVHDGDKVLAAHVAAGSSKDTERGWRLVKNPKLKRPIDLLIGMTIAFARASNRPGPAGVEWW